MRSKSGPDKNRRRSKEGQGAKPIAASKPIKAEDRSDAERSRPRRARKPEQGGGRSEDERSRH